MDFYRHLAVMMFLRAWTASICTLWLIQNLSIQPAVTTGFCLYVQTVLVLCPIEGTLSSLGHRRASNIVQQLNVQCHLVCSSALCWFAGTVMKPHSGLSCEQDENEEPQPSKSGHQTATLNEPKKYKWARLAYKVLTEKREYMECWKIARWDTVMTLHILCTSASYPITPAKCVWRLLTIMSGIASNLKHQAYGFYKQARVLAHKRSLRQVELSCQGQSPAEVVFAGDHISNKLFSW